MNIQNGSPLVSIIIAVYNGADTLEACLKSVIEQTYINKELIIIDGGSVDATVDLIRAYEKHITYWVSEPDRGIYDAWNKGLERSSGEWICFLGSDDSLATCNTLERMVDQINKDTSIEFLSGSARLYYSDGQLKRVKGKSWQWPQFKRNMGGIVHPGSFHSKNLFDCYGKFDTSYQIAGDYDFLLRMGPKLKASFFPEVVVNVGLSGASNKYAVKACLEAYKAHIQCDYINKREAQIYLLLILIKYYAGLIKYGIIIRFRKLLKNFEVKFASFN